MSRIALELAIDSTSVTPELCCDFIDTNSLLSERRNHIPFVLSEVRVFHVFYFLARAKFMIIAPYCFLCSEVSHFVLESKPLNRALVFESNRRM